MLARVLDEASYTCRLPKVNHDFFGSTYNEDSSNLGYIRGSTFCLGNDHILINNGILIVRPKDKETSFETPSSTRSWT